MAPDSQTKKIFLVLLGFTLLLSTASAAGLDLEDGTVWLNDDNKDKVEATISGSNEANLTINSPNINETTVRLGNGTVKNSDFPKNVQVGKYTLKLYDNSSEVADITEISLKELSVEIKNDGTGYVTKKLGNPPNTDALKLDMVVKAKENEKVEKESITREEFNIISREARFTDNKDVNAVQGGTEGKTSKVTLNPKIVEAHPQEEELVLLVEYAHEGSTVTVRKRFNPKVYSVQGVPVGDTPPILMEYDDIDEFAYNVNILEDGQDTNPKLYSEDFDLKIENKETGDEFGENEKWLEVKQIDGDNGDYRLTLGSIPQLDTGVYTFTTRVEDPATGEFTTIDSIRVRNGLKLSGRVVDSRNRGIQTKMTLTRGDTVIPINTGSDGTYYKEIETAEGENTYDSVVMKFFDRGLSSSDSQITVNSVDFAAGEGENLAGDSESIKFQYWDQPIVEKKAINPINMMATKFAYPMAENGHKASMKFNPENVNTDNLKVFECSSWNFEGRACLGEWTEIDEEDVTVNYQSMRANFPIDNPYLAQDTGDGDQNILMNAYIIGTSADLVLNGGLSISGPEGGKVATGSKIEVEGNINSENENAVEGANVEIAFYQGDREIDSLDTAQTDITGRFVAKGAAPAEPGNYSVRVTADKENYNIMEKKFDNRFETVIEEGIAVKTGSTVEISPGEDATSEVTVQNTGQTDMEDVSFSFEGLDSQYYSVSEASFDEIPAGEERTTEVTVSLPSDYCDGGCGDWPTLDISATATNPDGEEFEADAETLQVQISRTTSGQSDSEETGQQTSETEETNNSGSSFTQSVSELENATGEFLASQTSLNMALGLIMVFMMVLAGAVKKQDGNNGSRGSTSRGDRDGRGGRPRVQKPNVGGSSEVKQVEPEGDEVDTVVEQIESDDHDVDSQIDSIAGSVVAENRDDTKVVEVDDKHQNLEDKSESQKDLEAEEIDGEKKFVCEETGEEFDTKAALKLHRQLNGLDD